MYVLPRSYVDDVIRQSDGDLRYIEGALGLDSGQLSGSDTRLVFITDLPDLRLPSGNESGANDQWLPGGLTSGYIPEAVIGHPSSDGYHVTTIGEVLNDR